MAFAAETHKTGGSWEFLGVQWLRLYTPNAGDMGSISGWGPKILNAKAQPKNSTFLYAVYLQLNGSVAN